MLPQDVYPLLDRAREYIDEIEKTILEIVGAADADLERIWQETCRRMGRQAEFRALNMVDAHLQDLIARKIVLPVEQAGHGTHYRWA